MNYEIYEVVIRWLDDLEGEPIATLVSVGEDQPIEGSEDDEDTFYHFFPDEWEDVCEELRSGIRPIIEEGEFRLENHGDEYAETLDEQVEPEAVDGEGEAEGDTPTPSDEQTPIE